MKFEVSRRARRELERINRWWVANRDARDLFVRELADAVIEGKTGRGINEAKGEERQPQRRSRRAQFSGEGGEREMPGIDAGGADSVEADIAGVIEPPAETVAAATA